MKNILLFIFLLLLISCKQEPKKPLRYADVDTSSNSIVHLTDAEDTYYSLENILAANKGKVIYLNFFNSLTASDLLKATENLENKFDSEQFTVINISTDTAILPFEEHLKITTLEHNYLARNFPGADFYALQDFRSIPQYMIYNKSGELMDNHALFPNDPNLEPTLHALINQQ